MLSGVPKLVVFLFSCCHVALAARVCIGQNISATDMSDVPYLFEMAKEPPCTHVIGDIFIMNLTDIELPVEIYRSVRKIYGSIIVINNTNIHTPIHFPSLRVINATVLPAITAFKNRNVMVSVGPRFKKAISEQKHGITFAVVHNLNFVIDTDQYNLWWLAGYPNGRFLLDSGLMASVCDENLFKPIAGILGWLFVALALGFSTVAFYDRPTMKKQKQE
ncbi:hypothetical protein B9Z55_017123 [Caenorhabditis nigoni]|uniref:Receptor L-domain domain-containing protein n=1 Tax=Caenorhabditis nigoni TaxID=1611254 RepID=A0A2G5T897_9PELO|nr:hypothetical protein B9Z55_017123 [Caenorhabditis nigoni]